MRQEDHEHVENQIQAYLDGRLSETDSEAVVTHCANCESCGRALVEYRELSTLIQVDNAAEPIRPMWPAVHSRISRRVLPDFSLSFATSSAAVAITGLALGLLLGTVQPAPSSSTNGGLWEDFGSTLTEENSSVFQDIYFTAFSDRGGSTS